MVVKPEQGTTHHGANEEPLQRQKKGADAGEDAGLPESPSKVSLNFLSCIESSHSMDSSFPGKSTPGPRNFDLSLQLQDYLKALEVFGTKPRTRTTLQRFPFFDVEESSEKYFEIDQASMGAERRFRNLDSEATFWDVNESKSSSSYISASSLSEEESSETHPDKSHDKSTADDFRSTKSSSQTNFLVIENSERRESVRKIKSENDWKALQHEIKPKSSLKRIMGKTSAHLLRMEECDFLSTPHQSFFQALLCEELSEASDGYEKISPLETSLLKNNGIADFFTEDMFEPEAPKVFSESGQLPEKAKPFKSASQPNKKSFETKAKKDSGRGPGVSETNEKWSPTLPELIDIYNSVLRKKKKEINGPSNNFGLPASFFSFHHKIKEKKYMTDIARLTINIRRKYEKCGSLERDTQMSDYQSVKEYVRIFQDILASSLTIKQIAKLNNALAELQDYSTKNYDAMKEQEATTSPFATEEVKKEKSEKSLSQTKVVPELKSKKSVIAKENLSKASPPPVKPEKETGDVSDVENSNAKELSVPTNLESVLRSCFKSNKIVQRDSENSRSQNQKNKFLCNLKEDSVTIPNESSPTPEPRPSIPLVQTTASNRKIENNSGQTKLISSNKNAEHPSPLPKTSSKKPLRGRKAGDRVSKSGEKTNWSFTQKIIEPFLKNNVKTKIVSDQLQIVESSSTKTNEDVQELEKKSPVASCKSFKNSGRNIRSGKGVDQTRKSQTKVEADAVSQSVTSKEGKQETMESMINAFLNKKKSPSTESQRKRRTILLKKPLKTYFSYTSLQKFHNNSLEKKMRVGISNNTGGQMAVSKPWIGYVPKERLKELSKKPSRVSNNQLGNEYMHDNSRKAQRMTNGYGRMTGRSSPNTLLFLNNQINREYGSVEFFIHDNRRPGKMEIRQLVTAREIFENQELKDGDRELPIFIHKVSSKKSDDVSFPAVMVHSDSFLHSHSSYAMTQTEIESVLKCSSETKFYPGKVSDKLEEQKPLVTFVLTPQQRAGVELPSHQLRTVAKSSEGKENGPADIFVGKHTLKSIERFIDFLSKAPRKKKAQTTSTNNGEKIKQNTPPVTPKKTRPLPIMDNSISIQEKPNSEWHKSYEPPKSKQTVVKTQIKEKNKCEDMEKEPEKCVTEDVNTNLDNEGKPPNELPEHKEAEQSKETESTSESSKITPSGIPIDPRLIPDLVKFLDKVINANASFQSKQKVFDSLREYLRDLHEEKKKKQDDEDEKVEKEIKSTTMADLSGTKEPGNKEEGKREATQQKSPTPPEAPSTSGSKKPREYKIKVYCNNPQAYASKHEASKKEKMNEQRGSAVKEARSETQPTPGSKVKDPKDAERFLEILILREEEMRRNSSVCSDTEGEKKEKVLARKVGGLESDQKEETDLKPKGALICDSIEELLKENLMPCRRPPCKEQTNKELEERIVDKIKENFQPNQVYRSLLLLEGFLKKAESSESSGSAQLFDVLRAIESKSKHLMLGLEERGWTKILAHLEEIPEVPKEEADTESIPDEEKLSEYLDRVNYQLNSTRALIRKIQKLNEHRLAKDSPFSLSQSSTASADGTFPAPNFSKSHLSNILSIYREAFELLKTKLPYWSQTVQSKLQKNLKKNENTIEEKNSTHEVHPESSAENSGEILPQTKEPDEKGKKQVLLRTLRKEIGQLRFCIQYLVDADYAPEIQTTKSKIAEKLKSLQETVSNLNRDNSEDEGQKPQGTATSLLNLMRAYGSFLRRSREWDGEELQGSPALDVSAFDDYSHLLRFLAKVWDTRNSVGSLSTNSQID